MSEPETPDHRRTVGGLWDAVGELQLSFLRIRGLRPEMTLLDIGCGALRAGVHLVAYLDPGNYFGVDADAALLDAGYDVELARAGQGRLPRTHLLHEANFAFHRFGVEFDVAMAHSLFSHLPSPSIRRCLGAAAAVVKPGGVLFATFFECPEDRPTPEIWLQSLGGVATYRDADPYHYRFSELAACAADLPWRCTRIGDWGHPRAQRMARFERL